MVKRVAIFPGYGSIKIPDIFKDKISRDGRNFRLVLAELIDELEDTKDNLTQRDFTIFEKTLYSKEGSYLKNKNLFYYKVKEDTYDRVLIIKVVDVDTSKKWKIDSYDGSEEVVYFNEPVLVDKELNMYTW